MIVLTNSNFGEPRKINKRQINNCKQEKISVNLEPEEVNKISHSLMST